MNHIVRVKYFRLRSGICCMRPHHKSDRAGMEKDLQGELHRDTIF